MNTDQFNSIKQMTMKEFMSHCYQVCTEDQFEFLKLIDNFQEQLKAEVLTVVEMNKTMKRQCECGAMCTLRHRERHLRSKRHKDYLQGK